MNGPLFITGTYRAGTGFISLLLGNHPDLHIGHHTTNWFRERHETVDDALAYAEKRWGLVPSVRPTPSDKPWERWDRVMRALVGHPWGEKQQLEWTNIATFLDWFPEGRAIHIIRDPRSVLASFREYTYHDPPAYLGAAFNCLDSMRTALEHSDSRVRVVRYEDAATSPEVFAREMLVWLGLTWPGTDVMMDQSSWPDVKGGPVSTRSAFDDVGELDVSRAVNRWKGNLSERELQFVGTICYRMMRRFGYTPGPHAHMMDREVAAMCEGDRCLMSWVDRWITTGEGIEAFPADPTDEANWQENVA